MKSRILPLLVASLCAAACSKNYNAHTGTFANLQVALDSIGNKPKTVTIDAAAGGEVLGTNGVIYQFPPNAFTTPSGTPVTGNIDITTAEYLNKGDMMCSKIYPMSDGEPLVSAGEYFMSATKGGQELKMANKYIVKIPRTDTTSGMQLYIGNKDSSANGKINWQMNTDTARGNVTATTDTTTIKTDQTNWVNGDRSFTSTNPINKPVLASVNYQAISITLTSTEGIGDDKDIMAFISYDGYNTIWPMTNIKFGTINETKAIKKPAHLVIFAVHHGYTYSGVLAVTPENSYNYRINLTKTLPADFKTMVAALP